MYPNHTRTIQARDIRPGQWITFGDRRELVAETVWSDGFDITIKTVATEYDGFTKPKTTHREYRIGKFLPTEIFDPAPFYEVDAVTTKEKVRELYDMLREYLTPEQAGSVLCDVEFWLCDNHDFVEQIDPTVLVHADGTDAVYFNGEYENCDECGTVLADTLGYDGGCGKRGCPLSDGSEDGGDDDE